MLKGHKMQDLYTVDSYQNALKKNKDRLIRRITRLSRTQNSRSICSGELQTFLNPCVVLAPDPCSNIGWKNTVSPSSISNQIRSLASSGL